MTAYVSTAGNARVSAAEAVLQGMPPGGGLYVPDAWPALEWPPPDAVAIARWAAPRLVPGLDSELVARAAEDACSFGFPLVEVEPGLFVLELFHGPTHAFKDVGARFMARIVSSLVTEAGGRVTVLVATSGDTGGAVIHAFAGRPGTEVIALYPREGVSERQRRQMTTVGANTHAVAVEGTFDDCQRLVKSAFADPQLRRRHGLTSANSINVARLLPQGIYYIDAARRLAEPAHFVVPSGNLGNLCAGLIAARMGMPARGFTAAVNANRGVADFLNGGDFRPAPAVRTVANAMDVGAPSNLERIRWLFDGDDDALRRKVRGRWIADATAVETISRVYEKTGYVLDPHTAVAFAAATGHDAPSRPTVVLATAHPAKFPEVVERATGVPVRTPADIVEAANRVEVMTVIQPVLAELVELLDRMPR